MDDEYLPFTLDAEWEEDSVIGTQSRILEEVDDLEELGEEEKKREARIIDDLAAIKEALKLLSPPTTGQPERKFGSAQTWCSTCWPSPTCPHLQIERDQQRKGRKEEEEWEGGG